MHLGCRLHCSSLHSQFEAFAGMAQGILGSVHVWRVPSARVVLAERLRRRARFQERHRALQRVFARICAILTGSALRSMPRPRNNEFHLLSRGAPCCCPVLVSCSRQYCGSKGHDPIWQWSSWIYQQQDALSFNCDSHCKLLLAGCRHVAEIRFDAS